MQRLSLLRLQIIVAARAIAYILKKWRYAVLALLVAFLFLLFLVWILNLELLGYLLSSPYLSPGEKVTLVTRSTVSYLTDLAPLQTIVTIGLVIGQGIIIAVLTYIVKTQRKIDSKALGSSTIASVIALFSVGCVSCGTSIIAPVLGLFFSGATASMSEAINSFAVYFSFAIVLYALYAVGSTASTFVAKEQLATAKT